MNKSIMKSLLLFVFFILYSTSALAQDGLLHVFYGFELKSQGQAIANVKHSEDVVVGDPIEVEFKDRCQISLLFADTPDGAYQLVLTVKEQTSRQEETYAFPINHTYTLALDEKINFSIYTKHGLVVAGEISLKLVNRIEIAS